MIDSDFCWKFTEIYLIAIDISFNRSTFFVAGLKEDDFASLTEQQIEKYKDKYSHEMILSVPKQPQAQKKPMKKEKHEYER